jgi:hypothetical protein
MPPARSANSMNYVRLFDEFVGRVFCILTAFDRKNIRHKPTWLLWQQVF